MSGYFQSTLEKKIKLKNEKEYMLQSYFVRVANQEKKNLSSVLFHTFILIYFISKFVLLHVSW